MFSLRDFLDANTEEDQKKRLARGGRRYYADDERAQGRRPNRNLVDAMFRGSIRLGNTVKAGAGGMYGLSRIAGASLFGSDEDYEKEVRGVNKTLKKDLEPDSGLLGAGTVFKNADEALNLSPKDRAKLMAGAGFETAGEVLPIRFGFLAKGSSVASRAARGAAEGAFGAAVGGAGAQLADTGDIDPKQLALQTTIGAATGGSIPVIKKGVSEGAKAGSELAKKLPQGEVGGFIDLSMGAGKDFETPKTPLTAEKPYYHGTQAQIQNISQLDQMSGRMNSLFGPGIYLTDNQNIAKGYSTTRGADKNAGKVLQGSIGDSKLFSLENKLPNDVAEIFKRNATKLVDDPSGLPDFSKMKGTDAIREIKTMILDAETYDDFFTQELHPYLQSKGYDGFSHIGGIQGGEKHNVVILFNNSKLQAKGTTKRVTKQATRSDEIVNEYADMLRNQEKDFTGGELVKEGDIYKRVTTHTDFYKDYYAKNGKAPTKQAWREYAAEQLEYGRADEYFQKPYNRLNEGKGGIRERGFIKHVLESPSTNEQVREIVDTLEKFYGVVTNEQSVKNAMLNIEQYGTKETAEDLLSKTQWTADDSIAAEYLLNYRLPGTELVDYIAPLAEKTDDIAREGGRLVQSFSTWEKLTPAGVLRTIARQQRKVRESKVMGFFGRDYQQRERAELDDITNQLDNSGKTDENIAGTLDDIRRDVTRRATRNSRKEAANRAAKELSQEEITGKKIASGVESKVKPETPQDPLVREIVKLVEEQYLEAKTKLKRSPREILKEVMSRRKEADKAFPIAQNILFDKYAGDDAMMKKLDDFFHAELGMPASSSTINAALSETLRINGVEIADIIKRSWTEQELNVKQVTDSLVAEGFDPASAKYLAKEVATRMQDRIAQSKKSVLEQMMREAPEKSQPTFQDKINKLSNLGALNNKDYLDLARSKLGLPNMTTEQAIEISDLAQRIQGLPDGAEKAVLVRQLIEKTQKMSGNTTSEEIASWLGIPRAVMSSLDFSMGGRQLLFMAARHPVQWTRANARSVRYFMNQEVFDNDMAKIRTEPDYEMKIKKFGLALPGAEYTTEEAFKSSEKLTGEFGQKYQFGKPIAASERAYNGGITWFRNEIFNHTMDVYGGTDKFYKDFGQRGAEQIGNVINFMTGRGGKKGGWLDENARSLSTVLFSPRLWASRLQMLDPTNLYKLDAPARKVYIENAAAFAAVAGLVLTAAATAGAEVETDARSSDFLKIKLGNTRIDILGGLQQNIVAAHRFFVGEKKASDSGRVTKLGEERGGPTRLSILTDLLQNKAAPVPGTMLRFIEGEDRAGNPINYGTEIAKLFIPLGLQSTYEAIKKEGAEGFAKSLPGYFGFSTQTYGVEDKKISDAEQAIIDKMADDGESSTKIAAYEMFYRYARVTPSKDAAYEEIDKALANKDMQKVKEITERYNREYAAAFDKWREQFGTYRQDKLLRKKYASGLIRLNRSRLIQRIKNLKEKGVIA